MKKIIDGKMYNTDTATMIGSYSSGRVSDFEYVCEELYVKKTGEYFLYGEGGPKSCYGEPVSLNCWSGGNCIIPIDEDYARFWAEKYLKADEYIAAFGDVPE